MKDLKITPPEGYEIDKENSTFDCIKFKPIENKLPMTWEELGSIRGSYVGVNSQVNNFTDSLYSCSDCNKAVFPTEEEAEASIALAQLLQLRNAWGGFHVKDADGYVHYVDMGDYGSLLFCFDVKDLRDKFQVTFKDLIEKASPLL